MSPCNDTIILETREVVREVPKNGKLFRTVNSISSKFNKGLIYNIVGPSGAGKSSFLRLLNRLDEPTAGEVLYLDSAIQSYKPVELRKKISMLFQTPYLFPGKVSDNLEYCCADANGEAAREYLSKVGLKPEMADMNAEELSVGEKQRVAIARSLLLQPEVLLLDEPTSALDPTSSKKIEKLIMDLSADLCLTVIMVTHNPEQALRLGGKTLLLVKGELIESGETTDVLTNPSTELGRQYIDMELS